MTPNTRKPTGVRELLIWAWLDRSREWKLTDPRYVCDLWGAFYYTAWLPYSAIPDPNNEQRLQREATVKQREPIWKEPEPLEWGDSEFDFDPDQGAK